MKEIKLQQLSAYMQNICTFLWLASWESGILFVSFISQKHNVLFLLWMYTNKINILNRFEECFFSNMTTNEGAGFLYYKLCPLL